MGNCLASFTARGHAECHLRWIKRLCGKLGLSVKGYPVTLEPMLRRSMLSLCVIWPVVLGTCLGSILAPELVPLESLVRSATNYLRLHPRDAGAHAAFADVHRLAFSKGRKELFAYPGGGGRLEPAGEMHYEYMGKDDPWREGPLLSWRRRAEHAVQAFYGYQEAMRLDPGNAGLKLRSAALMEGIVENKPQLHGLPPAVEDLDLRSVREAVTGAMDLADVEERKSKEVPNGNRDLLVSYRAAVKLVQLAGKGPLSHPQKTAVTRARALIKRVESLPNPDVIMVP